MSMDMIYSLEQTVHVSSDFRFREALIYLLHDLVLKFCARNVLHDQVGVFLVIIHLVVLDDIRMVELAHDSHLFHDAFLFLYLVFIYNFYGNFEISIMIIPRVKDTITVFSLSQ